MMEVGVEGARSMRDDGGRSGGEGARSMRDDGGRGGMELER